MLDLSNHALSMTYSIFCVALWPEQGLQPVTRATALQAVVFTPPLAGIEGSEKRAFLAYDSLGSLLWTALLCWLALC